MVSPSAREALAQLAARHRRACARGHPRPAQRIVWTVGCAAGRSQCLARTAGSDSGPPTPATTRNKPTFSTTLQTHRPRQTKLNCLHKTRLSAFPINLFTSQIGRENIAV